MDGAKLGVIRSQRPEVDVVRKPGLVTLHLISQRCFKFTECGSLARAEVEVLRLRNLHMHRFCRLCERWADILIERAGEAG